MIRMYANTKCMLKMVARGAHAYTRICKLSLLDAKFVVTESRIFSSIMGQFITWSTERGVAITSLNAFLWRRKPCRLLNSKGRQPTPSHYVQCIWDGREGINSMVGYQGSPKVVLALYTVMFTPIPSKILSVNLDWQLTISWKKGRNLWSMITKRIWNKTLTSKFLSGASVPTSYHASASAYGSLIFNI